MTETFLVLDVFHHLILMSLLRPIRRPRPFTSRTALKPSYCNLSQCTKYLPAVSTSCNRDQDLPQGLRKSEVRLRNATYEAAVQSFFRIKSGKTLRKLQGVRLMPQLQ